MNKTGILQKVVELYGERTQTDRCMEEMAELTRALLRHRRNENLATLTETREEILKGIADVQIMLWQMELIYGNTVEWQMKSIHRLNEKIADSKK